MLDRTIPPMRRRRRNWLLAVAVGGTGLLASCGHPTTEAASRATPASGDVDELRPSSLPEGWARCSGGRSTFPGAGEQWWAQTFGPVADGSCTALITVTQIPDGDPLLHVDVMSRRDRKIGDADAIAWSDPTRGASFLFTWAFDQNLLIEACCDETASKHLDRLALAALEGTRQKAPAHCTKPESDLDSEDLGTNLIGKTSRMTDREGCPIRIDVASMRTLAADDHCWPGVTLARIRTPIGSPAAASHTRTYVRDPDGQIGGAHLAGQFVPAASLPPTAVDTGYSRGGRTVWVDTADDTVIYVVSENSIEAWPRSVTELLCA